MKKLVREKLYEEVGKRMSVEEFHDWFYTLYEDPRYARINWPWVIDTLVNDENSEDAELEDYLSEEDGYNTLVKELLDKRNYFLDFRYIQDLDIA